MFYLLIDPSNRYCKPIAVFFCLKTVNVLQSFLFSVLKMDIFQQGITALVAGFIGVVGFVFAGFSKRLDYVEKRQTNHELHIVANYVQDADLKIALEPLFKKLDRMEIKLDDANSKLAEKQDRPR